MFKFNPLRCRKDQDYKKLRVHHPQLQSIQSKVGNLTALCHSKTLQCSHPLEFYMQFFPISGVLITSKQSTAQSWMRREHMVLKFIIFVLCLWFSTHKTPYLYTSLLASLPVLFSQKAITFYLLMNHRSSEKCLLRSSRSF